MPQSLSRVLIHLVFSTKHRRPFITAEHSKDVFSYLAGTLKNLNCPSIIVGGMPDHVHLLFAQARTLSISTIVEELKKESSKWAKSQVHPEFYWQNGYGAFSVRPVPKPEGSALHRDTTSASSQKNIPRRISRTIA
jgi:putative transposase